jgi:protein-disulfide isomerase
MLVRVLALCLLTACVAPVTRGANPAAAVARVDGETITSAELDQNLKEELGKLDREYERNRFEARKKGLEAIVFRKLVEREAKRLNIDSETYIDREIDMRLKVATPEEARVFYDDNRQRLGGSDFEEVKERIVDYLTTQRRSEVVLAIYAELKKQSKVEFFLEGPKTERKPVDTTGPSLGDKDARVVMVEYSDFQCPYCSRARTTVTQVLAAYPGKVRVVFHHFPLPFHENAFKAAEAAECAQDQGKFWAMHDRMFDHQDALDVASLKLAARELGFDGVAFDACLDSARNHDRVEQSAKKARALGVEGTPHFFINGVELTGAQPIERFREVIDAELKQKAQAE